MSEEIEQLFGNLRRTSFTDNGLNSVIQERGSGGGNIAPIGWLEDNSVTTDVIRANSITANKIEAGAITANEIAANTITASQIAANTITAGQLAAGTITSNEIATGTITANEIAANAITTTKDPRCQCNQREDRAHPNRQELRIKLWQPDCPRRVL